MPKAEYSTPAYRGMKGRLAETWTPCGWCGEARATTPDHEPPIADFPPGQWRGKLVPSCEGCNLRRAARRSTAKKTARRKAAASYPAGTW